MTPPTDAPPRPSPRPRPRAERSTAQRGADERARRSERREAATRRERKGDAAPRPHTARERTRDGHVDPRIEARRADVRRETVRRRWHMASSALFIVAFLAATYGVTRTALLDVDRIEVRGVANVDEDTVRAATGVDLGDPLFDVDGAGIRRGVGAIPWVEQVSVRRAWPNRVVVTVVERQVAAAVIATDAVVLVDGTGQVVSATQAPGPDLPRLAVDDPAASEGQVQPGVGPLLQVARQLTPDLRRWVTAVAIGADGGPELRLTEGAVVQFGSAARAGEKLVDVATVLTRVDLTCLSRIDVRVVHTPVVTRREGCR